jgi:hypothetical protein
MKAKTISAVLMLFAVALSTARTARAETLGEVLTRHEVTSALGLALDRTITSYGILDDPAVFCIAFY